MRAGRSVGVGNMALDPEELVTLSGHGTMKLRSAVTRAMMMLPKERKRAKIVREGDPGILQFAQIKELSAQWDHLLEPMGLP
ncbi:MAG: hypothetical protein C0480_07755 [Bradyrhizobium sp.]|nr:hypothetical protein [Bradyrhizobium sp.]